MDNRIHMKVIAMISIQMSLDSVSVTKSIQFAELTAGDTGQMHMKV